MKITKITKKENTSIKSIEEINTEQGIDMIKLHDENKQQWIEFKKPFYVPTLSGNKKVDKIWFNGIVSTNSITFDDGNEYKMTDNHKLLSTNNEWIKSKDLKIGDTIQDKSNSKIHTITNTIPDSETVPTYDIEVEDVHHYFFDNGVVSHNSSVISNSTNGLEPPRTPIQVKSSKAGAIKMVIPGFSKYKNKYTYAFDMSSNEGIINIHSIIQKWTDQGISCNHYYDPKRFEDGRVPLDLIAQDLIRFFAFGGKQLYYSNVTDGKTDDFTEVLKEKLQEEPKEEESDNCVSGACTL
jgi:ribonucleotide reductase alpha subunit